METTEKLPEDFKKKWVEALRSGEYEQAKGYLLINGQYCCLGVACRVAGISDDMMRGKHYPSEIFTNKVNLPTFLLRTHVYSPAWHLSSMNDSHASFSEIADYIETNL